LLDLWLRVVVTTAWIVMVATTASVQAATAQPYSAHNDLELRLGAGMLNGTDPDNEEKLPRTIKMTMQVFADRLIPIVTVGGGAIEIGPYARGALLDGVSVPLIAGGAILGYRVGNYEIVLNAGLAYATQRIGENTSDGVVHRGQTKGTYDLGLWLRYSISRYFISAGYQHNSNGSTFGLNWFPGKGQNPGYDNVSAGVGIRF